MACETVMGFSVDKVGSHQFPTCAQMAKGVWCGVKEPLPVWVDTGMRCCWTMQGENTFSPLQWQRTSFSLHPSPSPWLFLPFWSLCLPSSHQLLLASFWLHPDHSPITSSALHPLWRLLLTPAICTGPTSSVSPPGAHLPLVSSGSRPDSGRVIVTPALMLRDYSFHSAMFNGILNGIYEEPHRL